MTYWWRKGRTCNPHRSISSQRPIGREWRDPCCLSAVRFGLEGRSLCPYRGRTTRRANPRLCTSKGRPRRPDWVDRCRRIYTWEERICNWNCLRPPARLISWWCRRGRPCSWPGSRCWTRRSQRRGSFVWIRPRRRMRPSWVKTSPRLWLS